MKGWIDGWLKRSRDKAKSASSAAEARDATDKSWLKREEASKLVKAGFWTEVLHIREGDVILITSESHLTGSQFARLKESAEAIWPGNKVAIMDNGAKMRIVRPPFKGEGGFKVPDNVPKQIEEEFSK